MKLPYLYIPLSLFAFIFTCLYLNIFFLDIALSLYTFNLQYPHRLYYDQMEGIELDVFGAKKRRWYWKDQETHVHAPPFQPICIRLNRSNSIRVMTQEAIGLTFMANKRSCRFSVGARLKVRIE